MTRDVAEQSEKEKVSWGQDATTQQMTDNFKVCDINFFREYASDECE